MRNTKEGEKHVKRGGFAKQHWNECTQYWPGVFLILCAGVVSTIMQHRPIVNDTCSWW